MQLFRNPVSSCSVSRTNPAHSRPVVVCEAVTRQQDAASTSRRDALLSAAAVLSSFAVTGKAQGKRLLCTTGWGVQISSRASTAAVCADLDTAEAGDACRQAELANDEKSGFKGNYKSLTSGPEKRTAANVPVSVLGEQYVKETRSLTDTIETYITIDVYDKKRQGLIKQLKADALAWTSKYARGGSVRAQSAREVYIAADAVLGHLASNGLAPLPTNKAKTVREVINKGLAFLDEGR